MKLVSNQLGPNFTMRDAWYAFGCALNPFLREKDFTDVFETPNYKLASTARTLLETLTEIVPEGKKVGIPAVCCSVMATPFLSKGKDICWLDTDENGLIDPHKVEKHADEIGLLLIPHIFGQQAPISEILSITQGKNIITVEDGAHYFESGEPQTDYRLLSFGREKDISCVSGGALLWQDNAPGIETIKETLLKTPSRIWAIRHAIQPLILSLSLPWWTTGGRFIAGIFSKAKILPRAVTKGERTGKNDVPQTRLPRTQQTILLRAFKQRAKEISHRKQIANAWKESLPSLFPTSTIIVPTNSFRVIVQGVERESVLQQARHKGFDLKEWDGDPIAPRGVELEKFEYKPGQCPRAEEFIKHYITFPTNRRTQLADVQRFITL